MRIGPPVTKKACKEAIEAFLASVQEALVRGDGIELRRFGTFKVRQRKARTAQHPRTGEPVEVPPRSVPVFQPSSLFPCAGGPRIHGRTSGGRGTG